MGFVFFFRPKLEVCFCLQITKFTLYVDKIYPRLRTPDLIIGRPTGLFPFVLVSKAFFQQMDQLPEVESRTQGSRPRPRTQKKIRGQGQGHKRKCSPKKKKVFTTIFQAISTKEPFPKNFSSAPQNFTNSKNSAVLEPRTGQFSRT